MKQREVPEDLVHLVDLLRRRNDLKSTFCILYCVFCYVMLRSYTFSLISLRTCYYGIVFEVVTEILDEINRIRPWWHLSSVEINFLLLQ